MKMKNKNEKHRAANVRDTNGFKQRCKTDLSVYKQMKILCEHLQATPQIATKRERTKYENDNAV